MRHPHIIRIEAHVTILVEVIPCLEWSVDDSNVMEGAIHVQKRVTQTPEIAEGYTQESEMAPRMGQQVAVLMAEQKRFVDTRIGFLTPA